MAVLLVLLAVALAAGAPARAQSTWPPCPPSLDRIVEEGAPEPEWPEPCGIPPRVGREACARPTTLPRSLALRPDAAAGGVRIGMSPREVCRRWGAPRLETRREFGSRAWHYGADVPGPAAWTQYELAQWKMGWIISGCRYFHENASEPCRVEDRAATAERAGALGQLLSDDPPATADWVTVRFDERGRVSLVSSWRRGDSGPSRVRPGDSGAGTHEALGSRARDGGCQRAASSWAPPTGPGVLDWDYSVDQTIVRTVWLAWQPDCRSFAAP
jgi:hypothetical protein